MLNRDLVHGAKSFVLSVDRHGTLIPAVDAMFQAFVMIVVSEIGQRSRPTPEIY